MNITKKTCILTAVAAGLASAHAAQIAVKSGDIAEGASWGGTVPAETDTANFAGAGNYGPYTMSKDMTFYRLNSGGWGVFTATPQTFDLKGNTLTLTDNTQYAFQPCGGGPRNHIEFYDGTIKFPNAGWFYVGSSSAGGGTSASWLKLSGITMPHVQLITVGTDTSSAPSGNFNCELKIVQKSDVTAVNFNLSDKGLTAADATANRLIIDGGSKFSNTTFKYGGGARIEVTDGSAFNGNMFTPNLNTVGDCYTLVSNATFYVSWSYELYSPTGYANLTEVIGSQASLTAVKFRPGKSARIFAHDGATVYGNNTTSIGYSGPATVTVSNATFKAMALSVGEAADAAGSKLQVFGPQSAMSVWFNGTAKDIFGAGGSSTVEIAQGAQVEPWAAAGYARRGMQWGTNSSSNTLVVTGTDTVYDAYDSEQLTIGSDEYAGNTVQVLDGATYKVNRLNIAGDNALVVSNGTVNVKHCDYYHTSLTVGSDTAVDGAKLVIAGENPKIRFANSNGGVKVHCRGGIVFRLPEAPYAEPPIEGFWLNMAETNSVGATGTLDIDLSRIPESKRGERVSYTLARVTTEGALPLYFAQSVLDRVNAQESIKAVNGKVYWKTNANGGKDLVFTRGRKGVVYTIR